MEQELDAALNLSRVLRDQLWALQPRDEPAPAPSTVERKQAVHSWLDMVQRLTPGFLRAAVRPLYLNLFYYRLFPEYSKTPAPQRPLIASGLTAWSGYAPFLEYKQRLCRTLHMDLRGFTSDARRGLVSVVLPVHNGARYVAESIESVLRQTYTDVELIVVDDGSTDETAEIVMRHASDPRVRLVRQKNRKLPGALNTGFASARGEYWTWTSADNRMHPEMISDLVAFLDTNGDAEMVYADEHLIDESGMPAIHSDFCRIYQTPPGSDALMRPRDPGELNFVPNNYIGGCFLYRSWAASVVGEYDASCFGFEDYDYWLRMNALFRIAHLGKRVALYAYRLHNESLTARKVELRIAERTRYFLAEEEERRRFFEGGFDITLVGDHPWFRQLARAYRLAGHNVFEMRERTEEELYRHRATRAFSKSITMAAGEPESSDVFVLGNRTLSLGKRTWRVEDAKSLEYPLLAIANAMLWAGTQAGVSS